VTDLIRIFDIIYSCWLIFDDSMIMQTSNSVIAALLAYWVELYSLQSMEECWINEELRCYVYFPIHFGFNFLLNMWVNAVVD
jgi:hypothetical protein